MKSVLILFVAIGFSVVSCKGRDKCGECPTFSKVETVEKKSI